ncbi:MAG: outer membrane lipoprotein carrier protein LolA [Bryobacteraceae bacterium]
MRLKPLVTLPGCQRVLSILAIIFLASPGISVALCAAGKSANPQVDALINQVEGHYNRAQTLAVDFTETFSVQGRARKPESGTLALRKPGRMRWDYSQPAGKVFVSDGKAVYLYTADDQRVERSSLKASEDMRAPLAFLLGHLDMKKEFASFDTHPAEGGTWLEALAKNDRVPYERIQMLIAAGGFIRQLKILGRDDSQLWFLFTNERVNPALNNKLFEFAIPEGAEVVDSVTTEQEN